LLNKGHIIIGFSPDELEVDGTFTQEPEGTLEIELGGLMPGTDHDVLHVVGPVSLGGTLEVSYLGGFVAQIGNQFSVLTIPETSGSLDGSFDLLDVTQAPLPYGGAWDVEYDRYDSDQDGLLEVILKVVPTDIAITDFRADGQDMLVDYTISQGSVAGFDIGIYRAANGSQLDALLMSEPVDNPLLLSQGSHTVAVAADFGDPQIDYYLAAVVDAAQEVVETNETNNTAFFSGGAFLDETRDVVHVHGTDPVADAVDVVLSGNQLEVWFNGQPFYYPLADVSQVHVRTHDGADNITASVNKAIWGFGGDHDDELRGGYADDYLSGGYGNDTVYGGCGDDIVYGGHGGDVLYGDEGADALFGEYGGDELHGGYGSDYLDSGYGVDSLSGDEGDDFLLVVDGYGGDKAYGGDGYDIAFGDYGDDLDAEEPHYYGGYGGGDSLAGGGDPLAIGPANTSADELVYGGLQDAKTLQRWRELLSVYTEWQKKRSA